MFWTSVHGLNLTVPEDAPAVIKPWHERNDTTVSANSAVDDQVGGHTRAQFRLNVDTK